MTQKSKPARRYRRFTERRLEILRTAAAAFSRNGFTGATMDDIAEKVRMAKGNLYYYFPSKQDLLFFCQDQSLTMLLDQAQRITRSKQRPDAQLRELILLHIRTILEELPGSTAHTDFRSLPPALLARVIKKRDRYEKAYRQVIQRGMKHGVFRPCNVKPAVWAILGAVNWTVQWFSPKGSITAEQLGAQFADLFVQALARNKRKERQVLTLDDSPA